MKRLSLLINVACCISVVLALVSCAGVKCRVAASQIDEPVSFTPCVYNPTGGVFTAGEGDILKHFKMKKRCWAMFWRNVNLTENTWDISDDLRREIMQNNGDAVVNLTVLSQGDWLWFLSSLVPIIPSYNWLVVEGDVVRVAQEVPAQ